jgi:hypothetical protein
LAAGNGGVYDPVLVERWWRSSQLTEPHVTQSYLGTPASLPFQALFALHPLILLLPAAILLWWGLKKNRVWTGALGLLILAFRAEWALWIVLGLLWKKQFKLVLLAGAGTALLWVAAVLFWGPQVNSGWLLSLQHPPDFVEPGLGLVGWFPGPNGTAIALNWFVFGLSASGVYKAFERMPLHQAMAFSLVWALVFAPQIQWMDWVLLLPLCVAFFPHPMRPLGVACVGLSALFLLGLPQLVVLVVLFLLRMAWLNAEPLPQAA